ncbi:hypothetical protein BCA37_15175 [Mycobacterium sp. djl-10]|nr:hypothetical protein BCA37_15175 [Mycobacterium sp. djl-10]
MSSISGISSGRDCLLLPIDGLHRHGSTAAAKRSVAAIGSMCRAASQTTYDRLSQPLVET